MRSADHCSARGRASRSHGGQFGLVVLLACVFVLGLCGQALASPLWRLSSRLAPSELAPGQSGVLIVSADNLGDSGLTGADGVPVRITDRLPQGLVIGDTADIRARRFFTPEGGQIEEEAHWECSLSGVIELSCATTVPVPAYEGLEVLIPVSAEAGLPVPSTLTNTVSVQGGLAEEGEGLLPVEGATLARGLEIGDEGPVFGLEEQGYSMRAENENGTLDTQAGSHPFQLTTSVDFEQALEPFPGLGAQPASPALTRNLSFELPPGLLGNVTAAEQCSEGAFLALAEEFTNLCPAGSAVGVATVAVNIPKPPFGYVTHAVPLFNLVPTPGEPARFGLVILKVPVILDTALRTDGDYGVTVSVTNASEAGQLLASQVSFWGVPGASAHDPSRGWKCLLAGVYVHREQPCEAPQHRTTTPLLTLPTSCTGPLATSMSGESWSGEHLQGTFTFQAENGATLPRLEGCEKLPFSAKIGTEPVEEQSEASTPTHAASTPTGLHVTVQVPQETTLQPDGLSEADVQSTTVTLPEGVQLNPSAANGLQACSEAQIGYQGAASESDPLAPGTPQPLMFSDTKAECPAASKVGSVRIKTPLLGQELSGGVYLATPAPQEESGQNPFNSLIALYIVAEDEALGLHVKLAGQAHLDPGTGQLASTFTTTPQVPFEELELQLFGGPRASLATPAACGTYQTQAQFTPWSGTASIGVDSQPEEFDITTGPAGSACASPLPFAPALTAGSTNLQAGGFTSFALQLGHPDGDQAPTGLTVHLPVGNAAMLASVTPCPEPQAAQGACGPESEIGQATATAGLGPDPYTVTGGHVYITGPYQGAPFGLSIVTPAVAGPFDLGDVVVRSKIEVNPHTAQVTITSVLPTFVQGIGRPPLGSRSTSRTSTSTSTVPTSTSTPPAAKPNI